MERITSNPGAHELLVDPSLENVSNELGPQDAVVAFSRYTKTTLDRDHPGQSTSKESLLAFVVRPNRKLVRVELGPIEALENAVERWRAAVCTPIDRGMSAETARADPVRKCGEELRKLVFDPLVPALARARRLIVASDDVLHLLPLDALPLAEEIGAKAEGSPRADDGREVTRALGERYSIELHLTLREILWHGRQFDGGRVLLALGGASFNSQPRGVEVESNAIAAVSAKSTPHSTEVEHPDVDNSNRVRVETSSAAFAQDAAANSVTNARSWTRNFEPLTYTAAEARGIASLFEEAFDDGAKVLEKSHASREAFAALAPKARYVHLATHGWFAPESIPASTDAESLERKLDLGAPLSREEQVRGTSPMLLCGLALAGANLRKDELGHIPGLITAEEIASFDLHECELAVLSACDTNVGVRRAGQGVESLQKALHMAGARTVITSLWKVPDQATSELMLDFYRRIWIEKKPKARALWEAKMALRAKKDAQGKPLYSTRDWAAWVLTGDPN